MKKLFWIPALLMVFGGQVMAGAESAPFDELPVTIDLPVGWHTQKFSPGGLNASPHADMTPPVISIQACQRSRPECATPCRTADIRANFFYFTPLAERSTFNEQIRSDGTTEYIGSSTMIDNGASTHITSYVLCSPRGIVYLNLAYAGEAKDDALEARLAQVAKSAQWDVRASSGAR